MARKKLPETGFFNKHRNKIEFAGPDDCWLWTATTAMGYGRVRARGKMRYAHREAFEAERGPIPVGTGCHGTCVRHRCDTPACVNPAHLELGTQADNVRDMTERGRQVAPKGYAHGRAKLTEVDVAAIRAAYVRGCREHGQGALARRFGVARTLVSRIVRREAWGHVC